MGRVGSYRDVQKYETGTVITTINLGVKRGENKYNNFFIKFFDKEGVNYSEFFGKIAEGEYIQVQGSLNVSEWVPEGANPETDKKRKIDIIGYDATQVTYNQQLQEWQYTKNYITADGRTPLGVYRDAEEVPFG